MPTTPAILHPLGDARRPALSLSALRFIRASRRSPKLLRTDYGLAYMTLLASILCYLIFYYALDHMPASRLAAFSYLQPVIAALTAFVFLHEPVTLPVAAGGALVLGGVWVTGRG
ncbi:MAG: EamA family transporter [Acidobacteriota bacterium]